MRFFTPIYLLGLLLIPILGFFFWWAIARRKKLLARFGEIPLIMKVSQGISFRRLGSKAVLVLIAVVFLALASARPQLGTHREMVKRQGLDIIIGVDVSASMASLDVQPGPISRLEKAKQQVRSIIDPQWLKGDRVGIMAFAGVAFVQCPLTLDYAAARMFLDAVDFDLIPVPGTNLTDAINKSIEAYNREEKKHKILILLTDGENHEDDVLDAARKAREEGIKIYAIGIGNPAGEPIPIYNQRGEKVGFKKDDSGQVVISRLDEKTLTQIAMITGGKYYRASPSDLELTKIYDNISSLEKKELEGRLVLRYDDRYQWPLAVALVFIIWEGVLPERLRFKRRGDNSR